MDHSNADFQQLRDSDDVLRRRTASADSRRERKVSAVSANISPGPNGPPVVDELRQTEVNLANHDFCNNKITTSKYTLVSFVPRSLFEQFRRVANIYFLGISILMVIGTYAPSVFESPLLPFSTIGPLILVLAITMAKEGVEDFKRHRSDREVNNRKVSVLQAGGPDLETTWLELRVGQVIRVHNKHEVPADIILLQTSEAQGLCYIETSNIDGETNLKIKEAVPGVAKACPTPAQVAAFRGVATYEHPNGSIYTFDGTLLQEGKHKDEGMPLGPNNMVLRGCTLRNTGWVLGLVVFSGVETKVMKKGAGGRSKMSRIEKTVNLCIGLILSTQVLLCTISTILEHVWSDGNSDAPYLALGDQHYKLPTWLANWLTFFILYNNFIPISLYVTIEMVNYVQAMLVDSDAAMYDPETNTPAKARTSNLNQDLGQIEYIFSDKTGTLTRNLMEFKMCSIGGVKFGRMDNEINPTSPGSSPVPSFHAPELEAAVRSGGDSHSIGVPLSDVNDFFMCLALCHTVVPERDTPSSPIVYQAESPDEGALVQTAATLGFQFVSRTSDSETVHRQGHEETYQILGVHAFDATRKRMSMVVRAPDGQAILLIKGADNVMLERASREQTVRVLNSHLTDFSKLGLRTLVLGQRYLTAMETDAWHAAYKRAVNSVLNRSERLEEVAAMVETDLTILGATAIEDKLQVGVPETIASLAEAGIKTWVLTGDKVETAINIGYSCRLLTQEMSVEELTMSDPVELEQRMQSLIDAVLLPADVHKPTCCEKLCWHLVCGACRKRRAVVRRAIDGLRPMALVVSGQALGYIFADKRLQHQFLSLAMAATAVVACRVSPPQKAAIVRMVRKSVPGNPVTLAIGDGANDVDMIKQAEVGVGISGREGLQAVNSSDFAIAQFRFLLPLLLIHGRWSYRRMAKVFLYSFFKNVVLTFTLFYFNIFTGWSGTSLYDSLVYSGFNFFLGLPIIGVGVFDRDMHKLTMMTEPRVYASGLHKMHLNMGKMLEWIAHALVLSAVVFWITFGSMIQDYQWDVSGRSDGKDVAGMAVYTVLIFAMQLKAAEETFTWTKVNTVLMVASIIGFFVFIMVYSELYSASPEFYGVAVATYSRGTFWLLLALSVGVCVLLDFGVEYLRREFFPTAIDVLIERERMHHQPHSRSQSESLERLPLNAAHITRNPSYLATVDGGSAPTNGHRAAPGPSAGSSSSSSSKKNRPPTSGRSRQRSERSVGSKRGDECARSMVSEAESVDLADEAETHRRLSAVFLTSRLVEMGSPHDSWLSSNPVPV